MDSVNQLPVSQEEHTDLTPAQNEGGEMNIAAAMHNRDQFKLYVSNLNNFMSQKEALKLFNDHNIPGIKYVLSEFAFL